jgi:TetR/AcrR family transcriptional regulator
VLKAKFRRVVEGSQAAVCPESSPIEQVRTLITEFFQLLAEDPGLVRLVGWESLSEGRRAGEVLVDLVSAGLEELIVALQGGINRGVLRADLNVRKLVMSVHALCTFYFSNRALLLSVWEEDISEAATRKEVLNHILSLVLLGIVAEPHRSAVQFH